MLVKHGKDLITNGDFAAARLLLKRAADGGSAEEALALGATFDPSFIRQLGAIGIQPDVDRARDMVPKGRRARFNCRIEATREPTGSSLRDLRLAEVKAVLWNSS